MNTKPLLFIDVDGVLNRMVTPAVAAERGLLSVRLTPSTSTISFMMNLDVNDGPVLMGMTDVFDLAWGTTWENDANTLIAPKIGLPGDLPVATTRYHEYSKAKGVLRLAAGRPFVWLDDALSAQDKQQIFADSPDSMVIDVNESVGLSAKNLKVARTWAQGLHE